MDVGLNFLLLRLHFTSPPQVQYLWMEFICCVPVIFQQIHLSLFSNPSNLVDWFFFSTQMRSWNQSTQIKINSNIKIVLQGGAQREPWAKKSLNIVAWETNIMRHTSEAEWIIQEKIKRVQKAAMFN